MTMMRNVQIDMEIRDLAPYTDPLKRPKKKRKCIYKTVNAFMVP
jgi:hypothetical protein